MSENTGFVPKYGDVAVLVPCYNEERTVEQVVRDFAAALPGATVYVYDNCSTDQTYENAVASGAVVRRCSVQGKGATVREMFRDVEAGRYLITDGDCTYPARFAPAMLEKLSAHDMVIGDRLSGNYYEDNKRRGHGFGNWLVKFLVNWWFRGNVTDIMTGYRAFRRDFVKSVVLEKDGFEVETEMTIWALRHGRSIGAVPIEYEDRPEGSVSKLNTVRDGTKVLWLIVRKRLSRS